MLALALTAAAVAVLGAADPRGLSDTPSDVPAAASFSTASVYVLNPWTDGLLLGATTVSWIVLSAAGPSWVTPHCPCDPSQVPAFDRVALHWHSQAAEVASNVTEVLALLAPVGVDLVDVGFGQALFEDMVVYGEVLSISGTATEAAKYGVQRPRPYVYGSTSTAVLKSSASYTSFFSGHSTVTFGALTTLAMTETLRHGPLVWPWLLVGLLGTSVAVERVLAGQHFPTDVIVGAAVGIGTGVLVAWLHRRENPAEPQVSLVFRPGGAGLQVSGLW
jgi:membrane-associated phospholipid phosphatase